MPQEAAENKELQEPVDIKQEPEQKQEAKQEAQQVQEVKTPVVKQEIKNLEGANNTMADTQVKKVREMMIAENIPYYDSLVIKAPQVCEIRCEGICEYRRGFLMMENTAKPGFYVPATLEGIKNQDIDIVILADGMNICVEGEYHVIGGYFSGEYDSSCIWLDYAAEEDNREELIAAIRDDLRKRGIILR